MRGLLLVVVVLFVLLIFSYVSYLRAERRVARLRKQVATLERQQRAYIEVISSFEGGGTAEEILAALKKGPLEF